MSLNNHEPPPAPPLPQGHLPRNPPGQEQDDPSDVQHPPRLDSGHRVSGPRMSIAGADMPGVPVCGAQESHRLDAAGLFPPGGSGEQEREMPADQQGVPGPTACLETGPGPTGGLVVPAEPGAGPGQETGPDGGQEDSRQHIQTPPEGGTRCVVSPFGGVVVCLGQEGPPAHSPLAPGLQERPLLQGL